MNGVEDSVLVAGAVDAGRVHDRLGQLARIGGDGSGAVNRIAFSAEEREASALVCDWAHEAGLTAARDDFGNVFASTDANTAGAAVSLCGSHLDTVPDGGRFDGALGVVAAVEAVEAMRAAGRVPARPLEVVIWRCEEPVRYAHGKVGSLLFSEQITRADLHPVQDPPLDLEAALAEDAPHPRRATTRTVASCLELHIEQGRRLQDADRRIGVVTAVAAPIRLRMRLEGRADHSGATPMSTRRDALCAAAEIILAIEGAGQDESPYESVATTANVNVAPGAMNVIPGTAELLIDVRGIDAASMRRVVEASIAAAAEVTRRREIELTVETLSRGEPTIFSERVVETLVATTQAIGYEPLVLSSGAGHDTQCLAHLAPAGMLFVPSVDGISHSPDELTREADVEAGARALAAAWHRIAQLR